MTTPNNYYDLARRTRVGRPRQTFRPKVSNAGYLVYPWAQLRVGDRIAVSALLTDLSIVRQLARGYSDRHRGYHFRVEQDDRTITVTRVYRHQLEAA